jgi:hypothetical protein
MVAQYGRKNQLYCPKCRQTCSLCWGCIGKRRSYRRRFQNETSPLLDQHKEQQIYLDSLSAIDTLKEFSESLGDVMYNITEYKKVVLLTFPLKQGRILCVSVCPGIDLMNFKNQVLKLLAERHH